MYFMGQVFRWIKIYFENTFNIKSEENLLYNKPLLQYLRQVDLWLCQTDFSAAFYSKLADPPGMLGILWQS